MGDLSVALFRFLLRLWDILDRRAGVKPDHYLSPPPRRYIATDPPALTPARARPSGLVGRPSIGGT